MRQIYGEAYGNVLRRKLRIKSHNLLRNLPFQDKRLQEDCKKIVRFQGPCTRL